MKKQKAAPQNGTTLNKQSEHSTCSARCATKLELVATHLLKNGTEGASSLSGLAGLHDLNFRNSISDLRKMGITIHDERFPHHHSGGGLTYLKRYWIADRREARKVVELVNIRRKTRNEEPLNRELIARLLVVFPSPTSTEQPAA